jgi:hypothetical protein
MVFVSLSISLLLLPSSLQFGDLPVPEVFLNGFISYLLPTSYPLLFLSWCFLSLLSAISSSPLFLARCFVLGTSHSLVVVYVGDLCTFCTSSHYRCQGSNRNQSIFLICNIFTLLCKSIYICFPFNKYRVYI